MQSQPDQRERARNLRRQSTDAENLLWRRLRNRHLVGAKFRRQHPIGPYFADFCCVESRIVVELDGGQHLEQQAYDERRTRVLERHGFRVLRFFDDDVFLRTELVLEQIYAALSQEEPSP